MTQNGMVTEALSIEELENYIIDAMEKWEVPGLSVAIVKDGETVLAKGYGTREMGKDLPVDEHTLFAISGGTMSFTACALAILVSEGKMDWNDRMIDLLPGFKTGNSLVSNCATVIDALAHRTGLPIELLSFSPHPSLSRADLLGRMQYMHSTHDFRSQQVCNILMYVAAGEIIPAMTGISWDGFVRNRLFEPVGMTDSVTGPHLFGDNRNIANPHETEKGNVIPVPHAQNSNTGPAISIYSSAADMAQWLKFQLDNGKVGHDVLIPEAEMDTMRTSYIPANFDLPGLSRNFINQGLGLLISGSNSGHKIYSAGGDVEGMESCFAFIPEIDLGVSVFINSTKVMPQPLVAWIIDRYTDAPSKDWVNDTVPFYVKELEALLSEIESNQQEITDTSKQPGQAIALYAGIYQHPLLGDLTVRAEAGGLTFALGTSYHGDLIHANHDTFYIKVKSPHLGRFLFKGPVQFRLDQTGKVSSLLAANKEFQKVEPNRQL